MRQCIGLNLAQGLMVLHSCLVFSCSFSFSCSHSRCRSSSRLVVLFAFISFSSCPSHDLIPTAAADTAAAHLSTLSQARLERHRFLHHARHELPASGLLRTAARMALEQLLKVNAASKAWRAHAIGGLAIALHCIEDKSREQTHKKEHIE